MTTAHSRIRGDLTTDRLLRPVGHGPHRMDVRMIFIALPWIPADVQMCRCAYGVPANMIMVPASRITVDRPVRSAVKGQMSIQCGPIGINGLVRSNGSV